jgi:hypothetical protein
VPDLQRNDLQMVCESPAPSLALSKAIMKLLTVIPLQEQVLPSGFSEDLFCHDMPDNTLTLLSDYSFSPQPNMFSSASGIYSFSQTGPADLSGSSWDTSEGTQNFSEFADAADYYSGETEELILPFGQVTPKSDPSESLDDIQTRWTPSVAIDNKATKAEPMGRTPSQKNRTAKLSSTVKKTRPRVQSILTQAASQLSKLDMAGTTSPTYQDVPQYLGQDLDSLSVSPQVTSSGFYSGYAFPDGLIYTGDVSLSQHVNPQVFGSGVIASPSSWGSLSPAESRLSSPGIGDGSDDVWSGPSLTSPEESPKTSPQLPTQSPRYVETSLHPRSYPL